jgi:hypothetical protein
VRGPDEPPSGRKGTVINIAIGTTADVTAARDELRRLIEQLPEEQVPAALAEVQRPAGAVQAPGMAATGG